MTFLIIHKYLKFINFIFTVIKNYWDIRDGPVKILIFLPLPDFPSRSLRPGKQIAWRTDCHLSFDSSSPSAQAREREKVKEDPSTPFSPTTTIPGSHTWLYNRSSAAASFLSCYYLMWIPQPFPSSSSSPHSVLKQGTPWESTEHSWKEKRYTLYRPSCPLLLIQNQLPSLIPRAIADLWWPPFIAYLIPRRLNKQILVEGSDLHPSVNIFRNVTWHHS